MRILITGALGYVGAALVRHFRACFPDADLIGVDTGLFADCLATAGPPPEALLTRRIDADIRDLDAGALAGVDAVVHLAAVSNDPIGARFAAATDAINRAASLRLAGLAAAAGVGHFVFASSCSVYGSAGAAARREDDATEPLTAYARSKIAVEDGLRGLDRGGMLVTSLRFATACGMSDRLRLDLVLNDFVAAALATGRVEVLSDGSPWRPLIDVADMARAIAWAVARPAEAGGAVLTVNVGRDAANYRVRDLAAAVAAALPGTEVRINTRAAPDARSYRVDFSRFAALAPACLPRADLAASIAGLVTGLRAIGFADAAFRAGEKFIRLNRLGALLAAGTLGGDLRWRARPPGRRAAA